MNRIRNTSTRILASTAPSNGSTNLSTTPKSHRPEQRAPQIADTAEHHHDETVDDVILPEIGADIVDLAESATPAMPATPEPRPKVKRVDPRRLDAHRRRHAPVLHHRADAAPEPAPAQHRHQGAEHQRREQDDPQPVHGQQSARPGAPRRSSRRARSRPGWSARRCCAPPAAGSGSAPRWRAGFPAAGRRGSGSGSAR